MNTNAEKLTRRQLWWVFTGCIFLILVITLGVFCAIVLVLAQMGKLSDITSAAQTLPIIFSVIASLPIGTVLTLVVIRFPLRPMYRVIDGMKKLAAGQFDQRLSFGRIRLYRELTESFNTLAEELQHTEMLRSDFVDHFSHEFKTPIVSIRGFARILQRGGVSKEQEQAYLDIIVDESTRLASMATNVLKLTKIENQHILTDVEKYNLSEQLRRCILLLEKKWDTKQLHMMTDFGEHTICANAEMLREVWLNLLDNAIKFSPVDGTVRVTVYSLGEKLQISFANQGLRLSGEAKKRVFDKFWQGDASHASEGAGVGLAIVKQIVRLHRGTIGVESTDQETVFTVCLPKNG